MSTASTLAPAPGAAFAAAVRAILAGRPGVLFYREEAQPHAPAFAAVEPWVVASIHAEKLCWREFDGSAPDGRRFETPLPAAAAFDLLQTLWSALPAAQPAQPERTLEDAVGGGLPRIPVWFTYELGEWLEPAALRNRVGAGAGAAPGLGRDASALAGFLIPRAIFRADGQLVRDAESIGLRLQQCFHAWLRATSSRFAPTAAATVAAAAAVEKDRARGETPGFSGETLAPADPTATRAGFLSAVERVQEYIGAGDVYQVNVTRRERHRTRGGPAAAGRLFETILRRHPARLASFWNAVDADPVAGVQSFLSFTPERLLSATPDIEGGWRLTSNPIKGTRARPVGISPAAEARLAAGLMADPKEQAELNMIVDMARNDLSRIRGARRVRVETSGRIDRLPFVLHRVAEVTAQTPTRPELSDLLHAVFPAASITGAPKIRAMQIIRELEPTPRGMYCGALGWLGDGFQCDLALAIRTLETRRLEGRLESCFGVGAGIVADSQPEREWQETRAKARGIVD
ncbi:MAG: chorismate-binding protein [Planctomycetota bacterium]